MTKPKSLLIGFSPDLGQALPFLLTRAGFEVEAVAGKPFVNYGTLISKQIELEKLSDLPSKLDEIDLKIYDLIVVFDDISLREIVNSNLSLAKKLQLLPVLTAENFQHLGSKIALSKVLAEAQVRTPEFLVAQGLEQVIAAAQKLEFPVMLKIDFSGGGDGTFECHNICDIRAINSLVFAAPLLVQKKITGPELDLSAFYQNSQLIQFGYSWFEKVISKFGPSSLRTYEQLGVSCDAELFLQMQQLGKALGADGFVNVSAIKSETDGKIYFFEADMRPNVWVDFTRIVGDDLALRMKNWFEKKAVLQFPIAVNCVFPAKILVAHFLRISFRQILFNYCNVWKSLSAEDLCWIWQVWVVQKCKMFLRAFERNVRRSLLPKREVRYRIKRWFVAGSC